MDFGRRIRLPTNDFASKKRTMRTMWRRLIGSPWSWYGALLLALCPAWLAWAFTCRVPHADHWMMVVEPFLKWKSGTPLMQCLPSQLNDSHYDACIFLNLLIADWSHLDLRVESMVCVVLGTAVAAILLWIFRKSLPASGAARLALAWLVSLMWLSPDQCMNWTFGVQTCYFLMVLGTVATVAIFQTDWPLAVKTGGAIAASTLACYSFLPGWIAWGLTGCLLLWEGWKCRFSARWAVHFGALTAVGAAVAWRYFGSYASGVDVAHEAPLTRRLAEDPLAFVRFFLTLAGFSIGKGWPSLDRETRLRLIEQVPPWFGAATIALLAVTVFAGWRGHWRGKSRSAVPFLALSVWGALNTAAVALARTGLPASTPFQSRYLAFSLWIHFGLLGLLFLMDGRVWRIVRRSWIAVTVYGAVVGYVYGWHQVQRDRLRESNLEAACIMRHAAPEPSFLDAIDPSAGPLAIEHLDRLEAMGCLSMRAVPAGESPSLRLDDRPYADGAVSKSEWTDPAHGPNLTGWAATLDDRDAVDGIVISVQPEGGEERWLGLAQSRPRNAKVSRRKKARAVEERLGWGYAWGTGADHGFLSHAANPFHATPLPDGTLIFRAYALDTATGRFTMLKNIVRLHRPGSPTEDAPEPTKPGKPDER